MAPVNAPHPRARSSAISRLWLVCGVAGLALMLAARWAYQSIPAVHYRVALVWAWAYDQAVPHPDVLPTPIEAAGVPLPTFALPSPTVPPTATALPTPTAAVLTTAALAPSASATTRPETSATPLPPTAMAIPAAVLLKGFRHEQQYLFAR